MGWFRGVAGEAQRATLDDPDCACFKVMSAASEAGLLAEKFVAFDFPVSNLFFFLCGPSVLLTFPPVYLPNSLSTIPSSIGVSGTSQLSLCRLSRWPSLRSALECCFYIAASGGMWSLF